MRDGKAVLSPEEIARYLFRPVVAQHRSSNVFLPNGSRLYLDVGAHPEYATAECDSVAQLVAQDKAGEVIYDRLARRGEETLEADGIGGSIYLFKNNVDSRGNSYGAHENYLISRELALKNLSRQLLAFLITRQLVCGAGLVKDGTFLLSQRADQVWEAVSSATTRTRPIINTRDEPHGDSHRFRRMHVIVGDSNMSETTCALKMGSTQLVLEMLEADVDLPDFELADPISHIRDIAADPTGGTVLNLKRGGTVSAVEVQRATVDAARSWLGDRGGELERVVDLWDRAVTAVETQDFRGVETDIDWVIKRRLLDQFRTRLGCDWDHPKLAHLDLAYHDIRRDRGLFYLLQSRGRAARWVSDADIEHAVEHAPDTTRARSRGRFVSAAQAKGAEYNADWVRLKLNRPEPRTVELLDPFESHNESVDRLIEDIEAGHP
ncbi:Pup--protein ligase [Corynebacterium capitovis]|nr:Pup--protein ligase [Corynebacterium capitovis]